MRSASSRATSILCSIITTQQLLHVAALVNRKAGERFIEQQELGVLRQRHGNFDASALAIGGLAQRPLGDVNEADASQHGACLGNERVLGAQIA